MKLTRKQTIEAAKYCTTISNCATCCMFKEHDCRAEIIKHALHYLEENEPASAGTETSPEVSSNDTNNISHLDDTTLLEICQEALTKISGNYSSKTGNCDFVRGYAKAICDITDKLKNIKEEENANGKQ